MKQQKNPEWNETIQMQFVGTQSKGKLIIGCNTAEKVGGYASEIAKGPVLVVADPIVLKLGTVSPIVSSLEAHGMKYEIYSDVKPEPHLADAEKLVRLARSSGFDLVIGVGGGSAMDMAKLAALAATTGLPVDEFFRDPNAIVQTLPKILIPTTSGTGSEVSPYIVISNEIGKKLFIGKGELYATIALVDPVLTKTMPPSVTAATGLDALTHGIEGMTGATNPFTLGVGTRCAELVFKYLPRAVKDGSDMEARYYMSFASILGMMAYTSGGGLYAHSMSYILTAEKGLPHGAGCGLALPYTLAFNGDYAATVLSSLSKAIGEKNVPKAILSLVQEVGMPATLAQLGYDENSIPLIAKTLITDYYRAKNPRHCTKANAEKLIRNMILGKLEF